MFAQTSRVLAVSGYCTVVTLPMQSIASEAVEKHNINVIVKMPVYALLEAVEDMR